MWPRLAQEAMEVEEYFAQEGKKTITGLAYHLGFESRQSFYDYEEKTEFTYTIKRARLRIEMIYEERLQEQTCTGSIFALKNMGWKDKNETEYTGGFSIKFIEDEGNDNRDPHDTGLPMEPGSLPEPQTPGDC